MVFDYEQQSGKITASLHTDNSTQVYECLPTVCLNPVCDCNDVFLKFERLGETHNVGINIKQRTLIERGNVSTIDDFANQVFALLDETDFKILKNIYWSHKRSGSEKADFTQLKVVFPKDDIERGGIMIIYNEVLPYANRFDVTLKGEFYFLDDHYCVKNKCQCTEILLCFYPVLNEEADENTEVEAVDLAFAMRVNYQSKTWVRDDKPETDPLDTNEVRSAVENKYNNFYALVHQRHQRLKLLYSNYLKALPLEKSQKVARNDPCPCGSGKKYKKCCELGDTLLA